MCWRWQLIFLVPYRSKVKYDMVLREYHAFGILQAADYAKEPVFRVSCVEFGVAAGFGLMNIGVELRPRYTKLTRGESEGFMGLILAKECLRRDYRDHPRTCTARATFPMDFDRLSQVLPHASWCWRVGRNDRAIHRGTFTGRAD